MLALLLRWRHLCDVGQTGEAAAAQPGEDVNVRCTLKENKIFMSKNGILVMTSRTAILYMSQTQAVIIFRSLRSALTSAATDSQHLHEPLHQPSQVCTVVKQHACSTTMNWQHWNQ